MVISCRMSSWHREKALAASYFSLGSSSLSARRCLMTFMLIWPSGPFLLRYGKLFSLLATFWSGNGLPYSASLMTSILSSFRKNFMNSPISFFCLSTTKFWIKPITLWTGSLDLVITNKVLLAISYSVIFFFAESGTPASVLSLAISNNLRKSSTLWINPLAVPPLSSSSNTTSTNRFWGMFKKVLYT